MKERYSLEPDAWLNETLLANGLNTPEDSAWKEIRQRAPKIDEEEFPCQEAAGGGDYATAANEALNLERRQKTASILKASTTELRERNRERRKVNFFQSQWVIEEEGE